MDGLNSRRKVKRNYPIWTTERKQLGKQTKPNPQNLGDLQDYNKRSNSHVIRVPEGKEKEGGKEKY